MTTMAFKEADCPVCGATYRHAQLTSTNRFGSPDLDLRPPEMMRSTMPHWVHTCSQCGYTAENLDQAASEVGAIVRGQDYQARWHKATRGKEKSGLAHQFLLQAFLAEQLGHQEEAATAYRRAAWAFDDVMDEAGAREARRSSAQHLTPLLETLPASDEEYETQILMLVDLLRRASLFEDAVRWLEKLRQRALKPPLPAIVAFQEKKARDRDIGCYTVEAALQGA